MLYKENKTIIIRGEKLMMTQSTAYVIDKNLITISLYLKKSSKHKKKHIVSGSNI